MTPSELPELAAETTRKLHPLTVIFAALRVARQLLLPVLIGGLAQGEADPQRLVGWIVGVLALPAFAIAVLRYTTYRYRLGVDELVIDSGVLRRQHRVIPLVRVQNIDVRESALQRLFGVAELHVETAGSGSGSEASLEVLDREAAESLRAELLARRRAAREERAAHAETAVQGADIADGAEAAASASAERVERRRAAAALGDEPPPARVLARLDTARLAAAGATANEAGLIAAGLAAGVQFIDEFGLERLLPLAWLGERIRSTTVMGAIIVIALILLSLLVLGWVVSIVGSVVGYHDFTLERAGGELRKRYGLIGRRQTTVPLERVQTIRIEESLLRRPLGLAALKIETAGGSPRERGRRGAEAFVPIATVTEVPSLVRGVFEDLDVASAQFRQVHPRSRRRGFVRLALLGMAMLAAVVVISEARTGQAPADVVWWIPIVLAAAWGMAAWQYRHRGWALVPGYVLARSGVMNRITWIVPDAKIQTLHRTATPMQRRQGLSTVVIDTASGGRQGRIVDLGASDATDVLDALAARARVGRRNGGAHDTAARAGEPPTRAPHDHQAMP